jgi:ubiquitin carboxyl-terminal hydrolase L3
MASPIPVVFRDGKKTFTVLENNPEVMNTLASRLGLSPELQFYDVRPDPRFHLHISDK